MEFLNPSWLWSAPLIIGTLIYAYARKGSAEKRVVSSTIFLKQLGSSAINRKLPVFPPRVLFDLLLCALFVLALSGLIYKASTTKVAVVIDNSLSMGAVDADQTSLSKAKELAIKTLSLNFPGAVFTLFTSSPSPKEVASNLNLRSLKSALEQVEVKFAEDNLESAIAYAESAATYKAIEVYTDRKISRTAENGIIGLHSVNSAQVSLNLEKLKNNFSIQTISRSDYDAKFKLISFSDQSSEIKITAKSLINNQEHTKTLKLDPFEISEVLFPIKVEAGPLEVEIVAPNDSLAFDNKTYVAAPTAADKIVLVGKFSPQELKLDTLEKLKVDWRKPSEYSVNEKAILYIFHDWAPKKLPKVPALFIKKFSDISVKDFAHTKPKFLSSWSNSHEILKYLSLEDLKLSKYSVLKPPAWAEKILDVSGENLGFAGELSGIRYVYLGVEIFPFRGSSTAFSSILFLNSINWLEKNISGISENVYQSFALEKVGAKISYLKSFGLAEVISKKNGQVILTAPGIAFEESGTEKTYHAINFYSESESNLRDSKIVLAPNSRIIEKTTTGELQTSKLLNYALWLCLFGALLYFLKTYKFRVRSA
ncbi:MAG: BatA and WFA domain-containing protein [Bdellovibrionota bacterium]